jgi:hypothetical protein
MKLFRPRTPEARPAEASDSRSANDSRLGKDSKPQQDASDEDAADAARESAREAAAARARDEKMELRKQMLRVVLAKTVQKTNVPAAWIGGELNPMVTPDGEEWIEVRLSVQVDEPRFLTYVTSFQAELERRLLAAAPDVKQWLSGITWKFTPDAIYEMSMPQPEYWEHVNADRLLTARQKGAAEWDRESLEKHFSDTNPDEIVMNYEDTTPPDRQVENLARPVENLSKPLKP